MQLRTKASDVVPIRISDNGRHFLDRHGTPLFWMGDTLWHLYRSCSAADVEAILRNRKAKGFSAILVMLIGYEGEPAANINGDLPWIDSDPSRPNERYFEHVDAMMRIACELDFIQVLGVYHKSQERFYTPAKARESARRIAERYRDVPHIVWSMYPEARTRFIPVARALAEGLREGDGGRHLITVHPDPSPQSSSIILHDESWLAFNSLQTWNEIEQVHPMTASDYGLTPIKPAVMAEGGYEGATVRRHITALDIRRQAYWTYLAGGHHVYGHDENYKSPAQWRNWIDSPGSVQLGVYRRIVMALKNWWDVVPDQSIIARGVGSGVELNAAARARAGDWALVYLSSRCTASIRMDRLKTSERIAAHWINPLNGERLRIGSFGYGDVPEFSTPGEWEDALLLLEGE